MDVKRYYQETLDKWQARIDGKSTNPLRGCGLCRFSSFIQRHVSGDTISSGCFGCPALEIWPGTLGCAEIPEIAAANAAYESDDFPAAAAKVVCLLEENEEALLEAMREEARKCGLEVA